MVVVGETVFEFGIRGGWHDILLSLYIFFRPQNTFSEIWRLQLAAKGENHVAVGCFGAEFF